MGYLCYVFGEVHGPDLVGELKAKGFTVEQYTGMPFKNGGYGLYDKDGFTGFDVDHDDPDVLMGVSENTGEAYKCYSFDALVQALKSGDIELVAANLQCEGEEPDDEQSYTYEGGAWHSLFVPQGFSIPDGCRDEAIKAINDALQPFRVGPHGCGFAWPEPERPESMIWINDDGDKLAIMIPLVEEHTIRDLEDLRAPFEEIWQHTDLRLPAIDIADLFIEIGRSKDQELEEVYTLRALIRDMTTALDLAGKYLGKAVADDLMTECVRPPQFALDKVNEALEKAKEIKNG